MCRYESVEASATAGIEVPLPSEWSPPQVKDWLMVHATAVNSETAVNADVDLFEQGFDRCVDFFRSKSGVVDGPEKFVCDLPQEPYHWIAQSFARGKRTGCCISCQS